MLAEGQLRDEHFASAGGGGAGPRGDADFFGAAGRERFDVEDGGGGGVEEKAHFGAVNADFDDRQDVATLDGNFGSGWRVLRGRDDAQDERAEKKDGGVRGTTTKHAELDAAHAWKL